MQQTLLVNIFETAPLPSGNLRYKLARMCQNIVALFDHVGEGTSLRTYRNEKWNVLCGRFGVKDLSGGIGAYNLGVFDVPDTEFVLKVVTCSDVFLHAAQWMLDNPECRLFPRVVGIVKLIDDMSGVLVERCEKIEYARHAEYDEAEELRLKVRATSMCDDIMGSDEVSCVYYDLNEGNIMYAPDGRMVCVDPIAD